MMIIAHRGASKLERENTLKAFSKAIELGADGIELDVRKTADNYLVVFHDPEIGGKKICTLTLKEIKQEATKENYQVPELEESLRLIAGKAKIQIEIKEVGYEREVGEIALKILQPGDFTIISFNVKSLQNIKSYFPKVKTGLIIGTKYGRITQILWFAINRQKMLAYADMFSIHWKLWLSGFAKLIPPQYSLSVWTADGSPLIKSLLADKVVGYIVTNFPDKALQLKKAYEQK
ncbi:MAG: glycerophosphodiester phosphodiesterase [Candidatus Doudnabacteria bacterium]|jgi:glycerophosphoryl diester phosphodiesterase